MGGTWETCGMSFSSRLRMASPLAQTKYTPLNIGLELPNNLELAQLLFTVPFAQRGNFHTGKAILGE